MFHKNVAVTQDGPTVPNLVNMADGVMPPVLNPESVPRYCRLHEIRHCHNAYTHQETTNHGILF
jgi:hypothetical protein